MGSISLAHLIILLVIAVAVVIPFTRILPRAGIPSWVAVFALVPVGPLVLLWVLAFKRWPGDSA